MDANGAGAVVLDGVSKSFDGVRAVQGLTLRVPAGTIYGFLGPNGAGKTTTIRMIMDILRPDGGRIEVLGAASARLAKDRVGYMPEERGLYPRMKVRNVLAFLAELKGVPKPEIPVRLESWLKAMDLTGWQQKEVRELSRGMQRRLEFIAAVISDPDLIVMDEPFAGLDPVNLDLVKDTILRLRADGKTIILSTHLMEQAETLCDRILLINRGEKVLDGTLDEIRAPYESDAVVVELEGESGFIESLPMVRSVTDAASVAPRLGEPAVARPQAPSPVIDSDSSQPRAAVPHTDEAAQPRSPSGTVPHSRKITIELREKGRDQELLAALVGKVRVLAFEIKRPSLHEIFVRVVGESGNVTHESVDGGPRAKMRSALSRGAVVAE